MEASAPGYLDTYVYHNETGADDHWVPVAEQVDMDYFGDLLNLAPDYLNKGFLVGCSYYENELGEFETAGCGEVSLFPDVAETHYTKESPEGFLIPTLERDTGGDGAQNGEGTNPGYMSNGWPMSCFIAMNLDAGVYLADSEVDGKHEAGFVPGLFAGSVVMIDIWYEYPAYPTNPTGSWCTQ